MKSESSSASVGLICLLLVAAILAAFWPVLDCDFISYDDPFYVTSNSHVRHGLSWEAFRWAMTAMHSSNWHPLTWISHMLDCSLFGLDARWHHAVNLALHAANALTLFFLLRGMTGAVWRSAWVAALFAVHPMHVESVAWVSERKDVLSTFFGLLALFAYTSYARLSKVPHSKSKVAYLSALTLFAFSLLSKPMWVTLPCLLLLLDYWPLERWRERSSKGITTTGRLTLAPARGGWWPLVLEKLPFFALSGASCVLTLLAQSQGGSVAPVGDISLAQRLANSVVAYAWYVVRLFWPTDLAIIYPLFPTRPWPQVAGASVLFLAFTVLALKQARRRPSAFVGWCWYVGLLVPVIGLVQVGMQCYADRYTYLPYTGLFIVLAWVGAEWAGAQPLRRCLVASISLAAIFTGVGLTNAQARRWQNSETVFTHAVQVTQNNYIAHNNLGYTLAARKDFEGAIEHYRAALQAAPYYADAFNNLGCAHLGLRQTEQALEAFRTAVRIKPGDPRLRNNFGSALHDTGDRPAAILEYEAALRLSPDYAEAHYNLANSLAAVGRRTEAKEHYHRAIALQPHYAEAHLNLALDLMADGQNEEALVQAQHAVAAKPDLFPAQAGLGDALRSVQRFDEAVARYRTALELQPDHARTWHRLGQLLAAQNRPAEATQAFTEAVRLVATNADFQLALAMALDREGNAAAAVPHYRETLRLAPDALEALNNLAWILASNPSDALRDGQEAVRLAERACELAQRREALLLGTLAAAYAEAGRFADAVKAAEQARQLALDGGDAGLAAKNAELLELYRAGKAFRQSP
jgi:tetratricopeptide (TPR) repeat protein